MFLFWFLPGISGEEGEIILNETLFEDIILPCSHGIAVERVTFAKWFRGLPEDVLACPIAQSRGDTTEIARDYKLTHDYSLSISKAGVHDEGRYSCNIASVDEEFTGSVQLALSGKKAMYIELCFHHIPK